MAIILLNGAAYQVVKVRDESIFDYVERITADDGDLLGYTVLQNIAYYSRRYGRWIGVEAGDKSDGASGAPDIDSFGWIFHDELCNDGRFERGRKCTNWQASRVLSDILRDERRYVRAFTWFWATWLFGGGKARDNGMF